MKPIDVTSDFYAEYNEDSNVTKANFKVGDHVKISKNTKTFLLKVLPILFRRSFCYW